MKALNTILLFFLAHAASAQSYDLSLKQPGAITTSSNDSLIGDIVLGSNWESVTLMANRAMKQIHAREMKKFFLKEGYQEKVFVSLQTHQKGNFYLFEVLVSGEVILLSSSATISDKDTNEQKFYLLTDGYAQRVTSSDKSIFNVFGKFRKQMRDYSFSMAMDLGKERDLKLLIAHYNQKYASDES